jgi:alpha-beta hydrolase superfamily lysophospholipase
VIQFTAARQHRTFVDARGVKVHFYQWKAGKPKGVVQIAHGLGDHALRYEELAQKLVTAGFSVYADDHYGHCQTGLGQWGGDHSKLGRLGPGGMRGTVESVRELTDIIRSENPGLPLALLGHSWGSIIAQKIVNRHSGEYDALVLTGTAYRTLRHMNGGDLNARHAHLGTTGNEWLSRDPAVARAFQDDELTFTAKALKLFGLADSLRLLGRPARDLPSDLPVLIQIGSDDPFGGTESAELLAQSYLTRSGLSDVELIVYTDARHEIFNETNREEVFADTIAWLTDRLGAARTTA